MLGLRFCARAFSSCGKWGLLFIAVRGPLTIAASLVGSTGSRHAGSVVVAHGPSCSTACGIFPDQGSNPCPLHWQAYSQPLCHQGSPLPHFWKISLLQIEFLVDSFEYKSTLNISAHCLLACEVSVQKSADSLIEDSLNGMSCFSLSAFKILSLSLTFDSLIIQLLLSLQWGYFPINPW